LASCEVFPLSSFLEPEVLDHVGYVDLVPRDARFGQGLVEQLPGRTDKGIAGEVLLITRLLTEQEDRGSLRAVPKHDLRRLPEQLACGACPGQGGDPGKINSIELELGRVSHRPPGPALRRE
jgi:hypothetical protein